MRLALDIRQNTRRILVIAGVSFALVAGAGMPAFAATPLSILSDVDKDGLSKR